MSSSLQAKDNDSLVSEFNQVSKDIREIHEESLRLDVHVRTMITRALSLAAVMRSQGIEVNTKDLEEIAQYV